MSFNNDLIANLIKAHSAKQDQSYSFVKQARMKDYDPTTNNCKVAYFNFETDDYDLLSNWMPLMMFSAGMGDDSDVDGGVSWGMVSPPGINHLVLVLYLHGEMNNPLAIGGIYNDPNPPPTLNGEYTEVGEWLYKHKTGSYLKYWNNGDLYIKAAKDMRVVVDGSANIIVLGNANLTVGGDVAANIDGSLSTVVGGDASLDVDGAVTATIGGSLDVSVEGAANIQSRGALSLQSETDVNILSREVVRIQGDLGVVISSPIVVDTVAPAAPELKPHPFVIVPPLTPLTFPGPKQPVKAQDPDSAANTEASEAPKAATNVESTTTETSATVNFNDPNAGAAAPAQVAPEPAESPVANNITTTSAEINFIDPNLN